MIRQCHPADFEAIYEIINDAAALYQGVIPEDRYHDPYMSKGELREEIEDGVEFWGFERAGKLLGVMGIQDKDEVTLLRHAYVRRADQIKGIGSVLLKYMESLTDKPILIGTWESASWAIKFYEKNGYSKVSVHAKDHLLQKYWSIPDRQVETSVVLTKQNEGQNVR